MFRTARTTALAACCVGVVLTGCSASVKKDSVIDKATLEKGISDSLSAKVGRKPDSVTCPGPLKAEVGQSERCVLVGDGTRYGVTATISSLDKGTAHYDVQVDQKPMS